MDYKGYSIGDIISEKWRIINIERKSKSNRNRIIITVQCIYCGTTDENEAYMILKRKSCKYCRKNELESMIGLKQGRLQIIQISPEKHSNGSTQFICQCDCGNIFVTTYSSIKRGTSSCGCLNREATTITHGMTGTRMYGIWKGIKARCYCPSATNYTEYGGRGIKVCDEWLYDFTNFYTWSINNGYNDGLTLDRINGDGNYEPSNCRWITMLEQANNKRNNIKIQYYGREFTLRDFCSLLNMSYEKVRYHYNNGSLFDLIEKKQKEDMVKLYTELIKNK